MPQINIEDLRHPTTNIAIIGAPGTGKTRSTFTMRKVLLKLKMSPIYRYYDLDWGVESLTELAFEHGWEKDIDIFRYGTPHKVSEGATPNRDSQPAIDLIRDLNWLHDQAEMVYTPQVGPPAIEGGAPVFLGPPMIQTKWKDSFTRAPGLVVVDSGSSLRDMLFNSMLVQRKIDVGGTGDRAISWNDWQLLKEKIVEIIELLKGLPCFSIMTFHDELRQETSEGPSKDGGDTVSTGVTVVVPIVTGDLRFNIQKFFGIALNATVQGGVYRWFVKPDQRNRGVRTRLMSTVQAVVDQDFMNIISTK